MPGGKEAMNTMSQMQQVWPLGKRLPGQAKGSPVGSPTHHDIELKRPEALSGFTDQHFH